MQNSEGPAPSMAGGEGAKKPARFGLVLRFAAPNRSGTGRGPVLRLAAGGGGIKLGLCPGLRAKAVTAVCSCSP